MREREREKEIVTLIERGEEIMIIEGEREEEIRYSECRADKKAKEKEKKRKRRSHEISFLFDMFICYIITLPSHFCFSNSKYKFMLN